MRSANTLTLNVSSKDTTLETKNQESFASRLFANCDVIENEIQQDLDQRQKKFKKQSVASLPEHTVIQQHLLKNWHHLIF